MCTEGHELDRKTERLPKAMMSQDEDKETSELVSRSNWTLPIAAAAAAVSRSRSSNRIISPISWLFVLAVLGSELADQPKIAAQFGVTSRGLLQIASQCPSSAW
jgi:hypothetical protein